MGAGTGARVGPVDNVDHQPAVDLLTKRVEVREKIAQMLRSLLDGEFSIQADMNNLPIPT